MLKYTAAFSNFWRAALSRAALSRGDRGVTAVEYALILALIAGVIIVVVTTLGTDIQNAFCTVTKSLGGGACGNVP